MSDKPINLSIELELDENGRPSTDPRSVIKFTQQVMFKAVLEKTQNATSLGQVDMKELQSLMRDMNNTALTTRKLDQEQQANASQAAIVEMMKQLQDLGGLSRDIYNNGGDTKRVNDPYATAALPEVEVSQGELAQGEQSLVVEDYIQVQ